MAVCLSHAPNWTNKEETHFLVQADREDEGGVLGEHIYENRSGAKARSDESPAQLTALIASLPVSINQVVVKGGLYLTSCDTLFPSAKHSCITIPGICKVGALKNL